MYGGRKLDRKSILVYCPKCRQIGSLRFKDSKSNKLVVSHYSKQLYNNGKKGTYFHYIGILNEKTSKTLTELWLELGKDRHQNNSRVKEELQFKDMLDELRKTLRIKKIPVDKTDLINYNVDVIMNAFNNLYDIHQLKLQEADKHSYTFSRKCPHRSEEILIEARLNGKLFGKKSSFKISKGF